MKNEPIPLAPCALPIPARTAVRSIQHSGVIPDASPASSMSEKSGRIFTGSRVPCNSGSYQHDFPRPWRCLAMANSDSERTSSPLLVRGKRCSATGTLFRSSPSQTKKRFALRPPVSEISGRFGSRTNEVSVSSIRRLRRSRDRVRAVFWSPRPISRDFRSSITSNGYQLKPKEEQASYLLVHGRHLRSLPLRSTSTL
jgi:hypothetical protein